MVLLSSWLERRGHKVIAICPPGGWLPERLHEAGVNVIEMNMHGPLAPQAIFAIRNVARDNHVDVIHTHLTRATYLGYFAGALVHVPVISSVHILSRDFAYRWLPLGNHWYVTVSEFLRQKLIDRGLPESRVHTVYNGTDFLENKINASSASLSVHAELGVPADAQLVGQFGRVDAFKGAPILVQAAKHIIEKCPRAYFVFVGYAAPGIQQSLWELATKEGVDDRLRFTGIRNDVARLMEAMDVTTLPSRSEACSMAIIEAMASSKPVIATRAGGNPELVDDQKTGFLVERTPESLADAVVKVLSDPARSTSMGEEGYKRATNMFTVQAMARNMEAVYDQILNSPKLRNANH